MLFRSRGSKSHFSTQKILFTACTRQFRPQKFRQLISRCCRYILRHVFRPLYSNIDHFVRFLGSPRPILGILPSRCTRCPLISVTIAFFDSKNSIYGMYASVQAPKVSTIDFPRCRYIFKHVFRPLYSNIDHFVRFLGFSRPIFGILLSRRPTLHQPPLNIGQNRIFRLKKFYLQHVRVSSGPKSFDN